MRINANVCFQLEFQLRFCTIQELHWRLVIHRFTWPHLSTTMGVCCKLIATFALFRHVALRSEESRVAEIWRHRDVQCAMCVVRCSTESTVDHTDPVRSNPIVALSFWAGMQLCSNCNQRCIRQRTDRLLLGAVAADRRSEQRGTGSARRLGEQVTSARLSRSSVDRRSADAVALSVLFPQLRYCGFSCCFISDGAYTPRGALKPRSAIQSRCKSFRCTFPGSAGYVKLAGRLPIR